MSTRAATIHLFPVRHHSPRTAVVLRAFLDSVKARVVLIEGPSDCDALMDVLMDAQTQPPVAILGYRTAGEPCSALWPFAAYSPEWVAMAWARAHGAQARFVDITTAQALAHQLKEEEDDEEQEHDDEPAERSIYDRMADARGFRSFEEFWEASFETPRHEHASFREALLAYAETTRHQVTPRAEYHRARDAFMAAQIEKVLAEGHAPGEVVLVAGAMHVAALVAGDVDPSTLVLVQDTVPTSVTVIPYSFPRLSEQTGYGAGNRAPMYYQRAFAAGGDFRRATLEVLVQFSEHLRLRGFTASLADTIEAFRLACMLADIRGKAEPGLDEVREATVATMCRGDATHVDSFLWPSVVGHSVGKVANRVGKNSLQEEFWHEVETRRLPRQDTPETFTLKLNNDVEVGTSTFLHRLRIADVPYASFLGTASARTSQPAEEAGGVAALTRPREGWEAQWTPSTDVALVERIVLGDSLVQVCERRLGERLTAATSTGDAAQVMLESVVTGCPQSLGAALLACDRHAATDEDLPSLATACRALSGLVSYGSSRALGTVGDGAIAPLCTKTFDRAVLRVEGACTGDDASVEPAKAALRTLHELALSQPLVDKQAWFSRAQALVASYTVHPGCSGLACGLLYLAQVLTDDDVTRLVSQRLSNTLEPVAAANFLSGFFEVNALVLVKSKPVVAALDAFLNAMPRDGFKNALPMLRRAFSPLQATERRYLLENLLSVRNIGAQARAAQQIVTEKDKEKIKDMSADLKQAMDDLDDLL